MSGAKIIIDSRVIHRGLDLGLNEMVSLAFRGALQVVAGNATDKQEQELVALDTWALAELDGDDMPPAAVEAEYVSRYEGIMGR